MLQPRLARTAGLVALVAAMAAPLTAGAVHTPGAAGLPHTDVVALPQPSLGLPSLAQSPAPVATLLPTDASTPIALEPGSEPSVAASPSATSTSAATPRTTTAAPAGTPRATASAARTAATAGTTTPAPSPTVPDAPAPSTIGSALVAETRVQAQVAPTSAFVAAGAAARAGQPTVSYTNRPDTNARVLELTNAERAKAGLAPLAASPCMSQQVAQPFAGTLATAGKLYHNDLALIFSRCGGRTAGENVAMGYRTPEQVVAAWMASPGHKANILNPSFTSLGLGAATDASGVFYWVQNFNG